MHTRVRTFIWAWGLWLASGVAAAAPLPLPTPEQQAAIACMTPDARTRETLIYPEKALKYEDSGEVTVDLTFHAPDSAPQVKVVKGEQPTSDALYWAVFDHVKAFRVPCLREPVTVRQSYVFTLKDGRKIMPSQIVTRRAKDFPSKEAQACLVHKDGLKGPGYTDLQRRSEAQDTLLFRLTFTAPDAPPQVEFLVGADSSFRRSTESFVNGWRVPCLPPQRSTEFEMEFRYKLIEGDRAYLNDMTLMGFLGNVKTLVPGQFELDAMGCPFDVQITHFQPHMPNRVNEVATTDPRRKPLLEWLSRLELKLTAQQKRLTLGRSFVVHIPCGKIDL